jgi:hypothetical protein
MLADQLLLMSGRLIFKTLQSNVWAVVLHQPTTHEQIKQQPGLSDWQWM